MKKIISIFIIIIFSTKLLSTSTIMANNDIWINIYIHGIIRPIVDVGDMVSISRQNLKQSRYKHVTRYIRKNTITTHSQALQEVGLQPIRMEPNLDNNGSRAMVATFKKLKKYAGKDNVNELFYTFGWSGLLCYESRQKASKLLYQKLIRLVDKVKSKGLNPKVRILGFSHGGNVAVQMANLDPWSNLNSKLTVDELITVGMPVHRENDVLIRHPMFKKIYHFYSNGDMPQKLDFITTEYGSSFRRYQARKCFAIPDKLTQIQIRFTKSYPSKAKFNKKNRYVTYDPSHIEMWFFGWTPDNYNRQATMFPLPSAAFAPFLADVISATPDLGTNLVANVYVNEDKIVFTDRRWNNHYKIKDVITPFISPDQYNELKQTAWTRRPAETINLSGKKIANAAIYFATRQRKLHSHCSKAIGCKKHNCSDCKF